MRNFYLLMIGVLVAAAQVLRANDSFTPETLWELGRISEEQVSPDGTTILFSAKHYDVAENSGKSELYTIPVAGGEPTKVSKFETSVHNGIWRPDGKKIAFITYKDGNTQIWEANPDGTNMNPIGSFKGEVANFTFAPDMKHVSFTKDVKLDQNTVDRYADLPDAEGRVIDDLMYRHWDTWNDASYSHVFVAPYANVIAVGEAMDIMEGERFDCPVKPFGGAEQIQWHPAGDKLVYVCKKLNGKDYAVSTNTDLYLYDMAQKSTTNLTDGMMGYDLDPVFSNDGEKLAWTNMERAGFEADKKVIYVHHFPSDISKPLTKSWDTSAENLNWTAEDDKLYFIGGTQATYQVYSYDLSAMNWTGLQIDAIAYDEGGKVAAKLPIQQITKGDHNIKHIQLAGNSIVAEKMDMNNPVELYRIDDAGQISPITNINEGVLKNIPDSKIEKRWIKTTDGKDMLTWVIYPPNFDANKKYPALLYCQGGPQSAVSQFFSYRWNFKLMAAQGYIIVAPNRRGLPTFGQEWNDQISGDWGGQCMKDYLSAIDEVAKEKFVDEERLGAVGASFGGFSVYYLAGNHEKRFKTFISHCGLFNFESWYGSTEELFFANWDMKGSYWQDKPSASYQKYSPHRYVKNWDTPILVIHGEKDYRVPINQGMEAFTAAKLQGVDSKFLYFPDEGHWVLKPQNGLLWHREYFAWLDKYLK